MRKGQRIHSDSRRIIWFPLAVAGLFALIAVFGFSIFTGNTKQSNVGTSSASTQQPADINNDNKVDVYDLSTLLSKWNTADTLSDLNKDGTVNVYDLSTLLSKWGAVAQLSTTLESYEAPVGVNPDQSYKVTVSGKNSFVYSSYFGAFCNFSFSGGPVQIQVEYSNDINSVDIRPKSDNIVPNYNVGSKMLSFSITKPGQYSVEINGYDYPLFIFANTIETNKPAASDPNVIFYASGKVYDVGEVAIPSGKTVYIEGGAIVRGKFRIGPGTPTGATVTDVTLRGRGIVDSTYLADPGRPLRVQKSSNVNVEGLVFLGREAWGIATFQSDTVTYSNIKVLNWRENTTGTPDGIDTVGSSNVTIKDSFIRSYDDGITVKNDKFGWAGDVDNIVMQNLVIWNGDAGNATEIGWENNANYIKNINYSDIDIIRKTARADTNKRAALGIHLVDGAAVSNIRYEDIRVESTQENLMYFTIMKNSTSETTNVGSLNGIYLKNISIYKDASNYPIKIIGYDTNHTIQNITFENLKINDQSVYDEKSANIQRTYADSVNFVK